MTGAATLVMPVVCIDGTPIGDGRPGALTISLRARFHSIAKAST
jgi:D-alanine transaminase